jgi:rhodanese-related sulfurtransferase
MPNSPRVSASDVKQITPGQLAAWLADASREPPLMLDVREPWEWQAARIEGATHIPMREIPARVGELDNAREVVAICHHGGRSQQVAMFLEKNGFAKIHNLQGGLDAWSRTVDPAVPIY